MREALEEVSYPLHYTDISEITLESGYRWSASRTPQNTMRVRLSVNVRRNPGRPFVKTVPGVYGLKEQL